MIHCTEENGVDIGKNCSLGHGYVVHGASVGNNCIIGMNASVLDGAVIGDNCIIGAGAVVKQGMEVPANSVVAGVPGKVVRENVEGLEEACKKNARSYHHVTPGSAL